MPRCRVLLLAVVLGVAGCGGDAADDREPDPVPSSIAAGEHPATQAELDGRRYLATDSLSTPLDAGGVDYTLSFDGDELRTLGCNEITARYTVRAGTLRRARTGTKQLGCGAEVERRDSAFNGLLNDGAEATVRDGGDTLVLASGLEVVTFGRQGPRGGPTPVEGRRWKVVVLIESPGTASMSPLATGPRASTLRLDDGRVEVSTGCNRGGGAATYRADDDSIEFGPLAFTERACPGEIGELDAFIQRTLRGRVDVEFFGRQLQLTRGGAGLGLAPPR